MGLRVLHLACCPFPSPQGTQVYVAGLARAQALAGHRVTVLAYGHGLGPAPRGVELLPGPSLPGYRRLRSGPDPLKPALDLALARRLCRLRADVVHAHGHEAMAVAALSSPAPVVGTWHACWAEELPTYAPSALAPALRSAGGLADRAAPRACRALVTLSTGARPAHPRWVHLPPGIHPEDLVQAAPRGEPTVVYAGNPDAYQELWRLVRAVELAGLRLRVVSAAGARAWARWLGPLGSRAELVVAPGWEQARAAIAECHMACVPRSVCAGFPMKVLNFLGMGLPVAAVGQAAVPWAGVVQAAADPLLLARCLRHLADDEAARSTLGAAARAEVLERHTWAHRLPTLDALYREVVTERDQPAG